MRWVQAPMPWNCPWMRPSSWTKSIHSVRVLRRASYKIRLARKRAGAGAQDGKVAKLFSLIFQPYFSNLTRSSYKDFNCKSSSGVRFRVYFKRWIALSVSKWVAVLSMGDQPAECRTSISCLCELGLKSTHSHLEKGPPLYSDRSPPSTKRKSDLFRVPCLVNLGCTSLICFSLRGNAVCI